jgi:MFS family permease
MENSAVIYQPQDITRVNISRWFMLLPISAFLFYDFLQINILGGMSVWLLKNLSLTHNQLGFASSLFFYVNIILLPFSGKLLDRYHPLKLISLSILFSIIGMVLFNFSHNLTGLILWRSLAGISGAFSYLGCVKTLSMYFDHKRLGILIGGTGIIVMSGGVVAQYPTMYSLDHYGLTTTLNINILFGAIVVSILMLSIFVKRDRLSQPLELDIKNKTGHPYKKINNWLIAIYACLTNFPLFVIGALWGNVYLHFVHGIASSQAAIITSMIFIGNMLGAPLLGFLSDHLRTRRQLMIISTLLYGVSIALIMLPIYQGNFLFWLCLFFVLGISTGAQTLAYASVVDINPKKNTAQATSLLSILSIGGGALCQPLFSWVAGTNSQYQNGMWILLIAAILSFGIACFYNYRMARIKDLNFP